MPSAQAAETKVITGRMDQIREPVARQIVRLERQQLRPPTVEPPRHQSCVGVGDIRIREYPQPPSKDAVQCATIAARNLFSASAPQYPHSSRMKTDVYGIVRLVFKIRMWNVLPASSSLAMISSCGRD